MPVEHARVRVNPATHKSEQSSPRRKPVWSWQHTVLETDVSPSCKLLLLVIANHLSNLGEYAWPSRERLCKLSGLSERTLSRAFLEARDAGLLDCRRHRDKNGHLGAYRYYPCFPDNDRLPHQISEERQGTEATEEEVASQSPNWRVASSQIGDSSNYPIERNSSPSGRAPSPSARRSRSPREPKGPQATFKDGKVTLPPELRAEWAPKFGSEEKLDRVLGMIVGKMQPYSARRVSVHNQVIGWLNVKLDDHLRDEKRNQGKEAWKEKRDRDAADMGAWLNGKAMLGEVQL